MSYFKLIIASFKYYFWSHFTLWLGVVLSTMVIVGALIIGDSISFSLENIAALRLGRTQQTLSAGDRYFTTNLAQNLQGAPLLMLNATALSKGGEVRLNRVQLVGIDSAFMHVSKDVYTDNIKGNKVAIGVNVAQRLNVSVGDAFLIKTENSTLAPRNAPFVSDEGQNVAIRVQVGAILSKEKMGVFSLRNSQTAPFNIFINLKELQNKVGLKGYINTVLFAKNIITFQNIQRLWNAEDLGLLVRPSNTKGSYHVLSERVFIDENLLSALGTSNASMTYFVNEIKFGTAITPYSFVSTLPESVLGSNEIIVNEWLADDLGVSKNDTIWLSYYKVGPLRELSIDSSVFVVKKVVPIRGIFADENLVPPIPGLSDAGNCRDWNTGVPVDLTSIRKKDEAYWEAFKATPKAFIAIETAKQLWSNRFGVVTSIDVRGANKYCVDSLVRNSVHPETMGFVLKDVRDQALWAAQNGVDFGELFLGLSFFLLVSSMVLIVVLISFHLSKRSAQLATLSALGIYDKKISLMVWVENALTILLGGMGGIVLAIGYSYVIFNALNEVWNDIVRTQMLQVHISIETIIIGGLISMVVIGITVFIFLHRILKQKIYSLQRHHVPKVNRSFLKYARFSTFALMLALLVTTLFIIFKKESENADLYFFLGTSWLLIGGILTAVYLFDPNANPLRIGKYWHLSILNISFSRGRSFSIILMFAMGAFLVTTTGLNRKDLTYNARDSKSGTGGFSYYIESTLPVLRNLNDEPFKAEQGIDDAVCFVQLRRAEGDDASCLNLNRITHPAILGVDETALDGRFSFASTHELLDKESPWLTLKENFDGLIPAIADQTVIKWGLGLEIGDTLIYQSQSGKELKLLLVGGLANSIFQGYLLISDSAFLEYFPTSSGTNIMLVEDPHGANDELVATLKKEFRDLGLEINGTGERLLQFYSVENTYLSIFLVLGVLALILGTLGLGVILAKSIFERQAEIALLLSIGYARFEVMRIITLEYFILLICGLVLGIFPAVIATLPSLISDGTEVTPIIVIYIVAVLLGCGLLIVSSFSWWQVRKRNLVGQLRKE